MKLQDIIKTTHSRNEIPSQTYLDENLNRHDSQALSQFTYLITSELAGLGLNTGIIAVGSSTFPPEYWAKKAKQNIKLKDKNPLTYQDIDIIVLPEEPTVTYAMRGIIGNMLNHLNYNWFPGWHQDNRKLLHIYPELFMNPFIPKWTRIKEGLNTISTWLKSGRRLDILMGDEEEVMSLHDKLRFERKKNYPFSLIS